MDYYLQDFSDSRKRSDRYRRCSLLTDAETGERLLGTREVIAIPSSEADKLHTVNVNEVCRLDLLAQKYYNNPLLWWIIAEANGIKDPFQPIEAGQRIRIPSLESLYRDGGIFT